MNPKEIKIADYDYPLPQERIASHPCEPRDACRLLEVHPDGSPSHHRFTELPALLSPGAMLVCNNTRVINARILMHKPTGAAIEIFCLEPLHPADYESMFAATGSCRWSCLVGNLKKWKEGTLVKELSLGQGASLSARYLGELPGGSHEIEFSWQPAALPFATVIEAAGYIPIPPYLNRDSELTDTDDYQTVYSKIEGSVAAPTAGLHFTPAVLAALPEQGIERFELTLHVGAGTFRPVKCEQIADHPMHTEIFSISRPLIEALTQALSSGRVIAATGTTTVRTLESLPYLGRHIIDNQPLHISQWEAYEAPDFSTLDALQAIIDYMDAHKLNTLTASTAIMIAPGFKWRVVQEVLTNFHQPQSTLLLLVDSFLQHKGLAPFTWRTLYDEALRHDYRFLSYGDAMLLHK